VCLPCSGITFDAAISLRVIDPARAITTLCISDELAFSVAAMQNVIVQQAKVREGAGEVGEGTLRRGLWRTPSALA
jgi:hypothetical protein